MSLREIIKVPNPFLKVTAKPVTVIDENISVSYTHLTLPTNA